MESAAEAKAKRGPKATIRRQLTRVHTPATSTGKLSAAHCRQTPNRLCPTAIRRALLDDAHCVILAKASCACCCDDG